MPKKTKAPLPQEQHPCTEEAQPPQAKSSQSLTGAYPAAIPQVCDLIQYLQNTPGLHGSHAAQALTADLKRLWFAVDTVAAQGTQATLHLQLGPLAAAKKRTKRAKRKQNKWLEAARPLRENGRLTALAAARRLADQFQEPQSSIYHAILPLWPRRRK